MSKHDYFMQLAIDEAVRGIRKGNGGPFGACIVKNGKVLAVAHNTVLKTSDPTRHAEVNAIHKACKKLGSHQLRGTQIYATTEPCPMCFSAIHWAQIPRIYHGSSIRHVAKLGFNEMRLSNKRIKSIAALKIKITAGVALDAALELLNTWEELPKTKTY